MLSTDDIFRILGLCVVAAPTILFTYLGLSALLSRRPLREQAVSACVQVAVVTGLLASIGILGMMLSLKRYQVPIGLGDWVLIPNYHFVLKFEFDRLSVPFAILTFVLCGTIGAFASRYMHREPGFGRFFLLYSLFLLGMIITSLAGTIETLFSGWEMVGLSSALLVAFFHERPSPVRNGLRVWVVYRFSDAALLIASIVLHHLRGGGDFDKFLGTGAWPNFVTQVDSWYVLGVGLLLLAAAAGKSALIPFSGWLPRAMEGPTPSSAIFYGALSVHLGAFLLLRISPIFHLSPLLCTIVVLLGLTTAIFASIAGHVQTDIKSALCFASLTQVGIIVAEIGIPGLQYVALTHILGHACLRTLQFVRANSLLLDRRNLENALGERLKAGPNFWERRMSERTRIWLYRFALERGYLDSSLDEYIVYPFVRLFRWCDRMERRWTDFLTGGKSRESDRVEPGPGPLDEML